MFNYFFITIIIFKWRDLLKGQEQKKKKQPIWVGHVELSHCLELVRVLTL